MSDREIKISYENSTGINMKVIHLHGVKNVNIYSNDKFKVLYNYDIWATFGKDYHIDELLKLSKTIPKLNIPTSTIDLCIYSEFSKEIPNHIPKINVYNYHVNGYMAFISIESKNPFYSETEYNYNRSRNVDRKIFSIKNNMITKLKFSQINIGTTIEEYYKNPEKLYQSNSITAKTDKSGKRGFPFYEII